MVEDWNSHAYAGLTDRRLLLALRGVGPESEAESVRFYERRVTKVGPEVKHGREGWGPLNKGCERRCRTLQLAENATTGSVS